MSKILTNDPKELWGIQNKFFNYYLNNTKKQTQNKYV